MATQKTVNFSFSDGQAHAWTATAPAFISLSKTSGTAATDSFQVSTPNENNSGVGDLYGDIVISSGNATATIACQQEPMDIFINNQTGQAIDVMMFESSISYSNSLWTQYTPETIVAGETAYQMLRTTDDLAFVVGGSYTLYWAVTGNGTVSHQSMMFTYSLSVVKTLTTV